MKEVKIDYEKDLQWKDAPKHLLGAQIKMLREEGKKKTFLLKLPENFRSAAHTHSTNDQHIILQGSYRSNGDEFKQGAFRMIPAGNAYDALVSEHGALVLVIQEPL